MHASLLLGIEYVHIIIPSIPVCRSPADVVFALDASGSIGKENFLRVITFAKAVVRQLPVGQGTRVGMLTYGDNSVVGLCASERLHYSLRNRVSQFCIY